MPFFSKRDNFYYLKKEVTYDPKPHQITDDTATSTKQEYVAEEMKLLMMIESLLDGKLPTNSQLASIIDTVNSKNFLGSRRHQLSDDGVKLIGDVQRLLNTLKKVLAEKNQDELIQQFAFHAQLASNMAATRLKGVNPRTAAAKTAKIAESSQELIEKLRTIFRQVITNASFRELIFDLNDLIHDILSHMAGKEAQLLSQRNHKAARAQDYAETPDRTNLITDGKHERQVAHSKPVKTSSSFLSGAQSDEQTVESQLPANSSLVPTNDSNLTLDESKENYNEDDLGHSVAKVANRKLDSLKDVIPSPVQRHVDDLQEAFIEGIPEDKREALRQRIHAVLEEISQNREFQAALNDILSVFFSLSNQTSNAKAAANVLVGDANIDVARQELRTLLERFAGGYNVDYLIDAGRAFKNTVKDNYELRVFFDDLGLFLQRSMLDPAFIQNTDYGRRVDDLLHNGTGLFKKYCKDELERFMQELNDFFQGMRHDELTQELLYEVKKIAQHLVIDDKQNRVALKTHLLRDLATVVVPAVFERVKYIPIPRIEHEDENFRIVVEDVVLSSSNFLPNLMEIKLKNTIMLGLRRELASTSGHSISLNFYQIQCNIRDVPFFYKKKTGFPKISDCGVANVLIGGTGITIRIKLDIDQYSHEHTLVPRVLQCSVENLNVSVEHSQRDAFYKMFNNALRGILKRQIEKHISAYVDHLLHRADTLVTKFKNAVTGRAPEEATSVRGTVDKFLGLKKARNNRKGAVSSLISNNSLGYGDDEVDDITREMIQAPWFSPAFDIGSAH